MAITQMKELAGFNTGAGSGNSITPRYWHQDIAFLIDQESTEELIEKNVIFQGEEQTVLVGLDNPAAEDFVLLPCPPYLKPGGGGIELGTDPFPG